MEDILTFTTGDARWLSNMAYVEIFYDGITYPSTENFYQAMKYVRGWTFDDSATRKNIRQIISTLKPSEAKSYSRNNIMTNEKFEERKLDIMLYVQRKKYSQESFKSKLLSTGDCLLEEGNWREREDVK